MIPFMLSSAIELFDEMSKLIAIIALRFAEVLAIVRSVSASVAILTDRRHVVIGDLIWKMLRLHDRDIGLVCLMEGLIFFATIPPIVFILKFTLEVHDTKGMLRFIGCEICLNVVLQPWIPARVEELRDHPDVCEIAYFEFRFHRVNVINNRFHLIQEGRDVFVLHCVHIEEFTHKC